ncbi:MAG: hypothetical protein AAGB46_08545 [Verrucomicrobiota bacterium]
MPGLAYKPSTSSLYGASGQTDILYTINTNTGTATPHWLPWDQHLILRPRLLRDDRNALSIGLKH